MHADKAGAYPSGAIIELTFSKILDQGEPECNDTLHNDIHHNDIQLNDIHCDDIQH
jgi:hypothetical protein